jgi:hypothetical protein
MLRPLGNVLTVLGSLSGLLAGYLWWRAAATDGKIAFAQISKDAALVTGISAMFIALAEAIRLIRRHRSDVREMAYYPGHRLGAAAHSGQRLLRRQAARTAEAEANRADGDQDQATKPVEGDAVR